MTSARHRSAGLVALVVLASLATPVVVADGDSILTLTDPRDGGRVAVDTASGLLHVVYFATWCPECIEELPALTDLEDRWAERDYRLVLVAVQARQNVARLQQFLRTTDSPGRFLFDAEGLTARSMKVEQLPTHILLGPGGAELARGGSLAEIREPLLRRLKAGGSGQR